VPNVMQVLKQEIARIARKEAKALVAPVKKPSGSARRAVADIKRRVAALEKAGRQSRIALAKLTAAQPVISEAEAGKARITARGMRSLRRHLRLSGNEFAKLLGVTSQAVYNWDKRSGALKVRPTTRTAILELRGLGAREARERLDAMKKPGKPGAKPRKAAKSRKPVVKKPKARRTK